MGRVHLMHLQLLSGTSKVLLTWREIRYKEPELEMVLRSLSMGRGI